MKRLLIFIISGILSIAAQEKPALTSFESYEKLPIELQHRVLWNKILPFLQHPNSILNLPALTQELQNLARINKQFNAIINDGRFMLAILRSLPRAAAVNLANGLQNMKSMKSEQVQEWLKGIKLARGEELYNAVNANDIKKVADILKDPAIDVNWRNIHGYTTFLSAITFGNIEIIKLLLAAGANVNTQDKYGNTALRHGNTETVKLLLSAGANVNTQNQVGITPLMASTLYGKIEIVKLLLAAGANLTIQNTYGESAIYIAHQTRGVRPDIAKLLDDAVKAQQAKRK